MIARMHLDAFLSPVLHKKRKENFCKNVS